jgi:hypothetical protein
MPTQALKPQTLPLVPILHSYIEAINKDFSYPVSFEQVDLMTRSLTVFVERAVDKYMKGQKEHGGDIRDRDLTAEILNEQIDQWWYSQAMIWKEQQIQTGK